MIIIIHIQTRTLYLRLYYNVLAYVIPALLLSYDHPLDLPLQFAVFRLFGDFHICHPDVILMSILVGRCSMVRSLYQQHLCLQSRASSHVSASLRFFFATGASLSLAFPLPLLLPSGVLSHCFGQLLAGYFCPGGFGFRCSGWQYFFNEFHGCHPDAVVAITDGPWFHGPQSLLVLTPLSEEQDFFSRYFFNRPILLCCWNIFVSSLFIACTSPMRRVGLLFWPVAVQWQLVVYPSSLVVLPSVVAGCWATTVAKRTCNMFTSSFKLQKLPPSNQITMQITAHNN